MIPPLHSSPVPRPVAAPQAQAGVQAPGAEPRRFSSDRCRLAGELVARALAREIH